MMMKKRIGLLGAALAMLILLPASDLSAQEIAKTDGTPVLVSIENGNIVAIKVYRTSNGERLPENSYLARATARANRLRIEFLNPFGRENNNTLTAKAAQIGFDAETSQAFGEACGVAAGAYRVIDARSKSPTVEVMMVQRASHRPRRSRRRDECTPFDKRINVNPLEKGNEEGTN
jgi:hypothetical protein